jgi:hypothetical protein
MTMQFAAVHESAIGRFCCKSLFALVIKISFGCTRDFRVNMWGTSLPEDKLASDLGNVIAATQIGSRWSDRLRAGKLSPGNFGVLQQYRRVEDGRGSLGHAATLRFPSPLVEPDVRISRIRLSDWLHRQAHETNH